MKKLPLLLLALLTTCFNYAQCWQSVAASYRNTSAIKTDGTLWAWGKNLRGQLGDGTNTDRLIPTKINSDNNWRRISLGEQFVIAIKTDGTL
ncbi:hypothetical protein ACM55H_11220 [Flavobacterium sp. ZT3R17]|uniref:hypothetical protein n=1 Tax=Flavobacterium cryoconiti TaxID=3398736 RepID=UPI003A867630